MQDEIKQEYDPEDLEKAEYLIDHGFIKSNYSDKYKDIREVAVNIHDVKMRGYDQFIKDGGTPPFEGKQ
jgi:acetyl-CoA carboxylase beta subunit